MHGDLTAIWSTGETPSEQQRRNCTARLYWNVRRWRQLDADYTFLHLTGRILRSLAAELLRSVSLPRALAGKCSLAAGFGLLAHELLHCAQARSISRAMRARYLREAHTIAAAATPRLFPYVSRSVYSALRSVVRAPTWWHLALGRASERYGSRRFFFLV